MKQTAAILPFLMCFLLQGFSQNCPQVGTSPDVSICQGSYVQISAYHQLYDEYTWAPATGLSATTIANPLASPQVTTTYTVTATGLGSNMVINGDFGLGNTGFSSGHSYSVNYSPCNYYIGTTFFNYFDPTYHDHSPTNDDLYMSIDGCNVQTVVWEETFTIDPNTDYTFGFWATRAAVAQPTLETSFTGDVTGSQIMATQTGLPSYNNFWTWDAFDSPVWNSGSNTQVTIKISNLATALGGVDFGIDDVSFRKQCSSTSSLTVTVTPDIVLDLGPDFSWCTPSSYAALDAGGDFTNYQWSDGSTDQFLNVSQTGTYWVTATSICSGAVQTDSVTISVSQPLVLDLGADRTICPGDAAHFNPGQFSTYSWTGSGLSCNNCADPAAIPPISGVYELTVTNAQGCIATDNIWINVSPLPELDMGNDLSMCAGDSVHLAAPDGFSNYQWTGNGLSCADCQFPEASPAASGTYTLNAGTTQGCSATGSIHVSVFALPVIELGNEITICKGSRTHFPALPPTGSYTWTPGIGLSCVDCANPEVAPSDSIQYFLTYVSAQGCMVTDSIRVYIKDDAPTQVLATVTDATCENGGTVAIEAVGNGIDDLQYNFNQQGFSANPLYTSVPLGNYLFSVRNGAEGCPYNGVAAVGGEQQDVFIPNAFTPDGNEFNNTWNIAGNCISEISCRILNRWGEEVALLSDLSQYWDGTSKGEMVPDGVYTYVVEVTYRSNFRERLTGFVAVLR